LTKIPKGCEPSVLKFAKVVAFGFHDEFEQSFG
jgi:hypothetical protein